MANHWQTFYDFNNDFWSHYADRHPNDGVRAGFKGFNPHLRVDGTEFTIKLYVAGRGRVENPQVGLGVITPENRSMFSGGQGRLRPHIPALAKALGYSPRGMANSALITRWIDVDDPANWQQAADWLHEHIEIYRRILSQPPPPAGDR